jgi:hypothetical protein
MAFDQQRRILRLLSQSQELFRQRLRPPGLTLPLRGAAQDGDALPDVADLSTELFGLGVDTCDF